MRFVTTYIKRQAQLFTTLNNLEKVYPGSIDYGAERITIYWAYDLEERPYGIKDLRPFVEQIELVILITYENRNGNIFDKEKLLTIDSNNIEHIIDMTDKKTDSLSFFPQDVTIDMKTMKAEVTFVVI